MKKEKKKGIYEIRNLVNSKRYVGQSINVNERKSQHYSALRGGKGHESPHLKNAWNKYGEENFVFEILEEVEDKELLTEREDYWIKFYKSNQGEFGYNIRDAADSNKGQIPWNKGRKCPERSGENHHFYGKKRPEETRKKMSRAKLGKSVNKGEKNGMAKLDYEIVDKIREEYALGGIKMIELGEKYGVSYATIGSVLYNFTWKDKNYIAPSSRKKPNVVLAQQEVNEIRERYVNEKISMSILAKEYKATVGTIHNIIHRKTHKQEQN